MRIKNHSRTLLAGVFGAAIVFGAGPATRLSASTFQGEPQAAPSEAKQQPSKTKLLEFKGIVVSFSTASITLRGQTNQKLVQSFTYTPQLHDKVVALMQKGGYQDGDKVTVKYAADTTVAHELSGKPSKAKTF